MHARFPTLLPGIRLLARFLDEADGVELPERFHEPDIHARVSLSLRKFKPFLLRLVLPEVRLQTASPWFMVQQARRQMLVRCAAAPPPLAPVPVHLSLVVDYE
jgi:hypothetical protein